MDDEDKTREQLISELGEMRQQIAEYESLKVEQESSLENWERMFDSIGDLVSVIDKDFRFVRVNRALANVLKAEPGELIGKTCDSRYLHRSKSTHLT